ncbi:alpha/beta hydrolase [Paenibacillus sp. GCM10023252]|uniref:alpha/beta hydrolase n=1 Tax=Paenibacillus sp. GCM10023252 TaxID=3252649 RepID=UPI0036069723
MAEALMRERGNRRRKPKRALWKRVLVWLGVIVTVLVVAGVIAYQILLYPPSAEAKAAMAGSDAVKVAEVKGGFRFDPAGEAKLPSVILYPGGLVEPESYSLLAAKLAEAGHRTYIADMPLNLAFTGENKADAFIAEHPKDTYVIGGHSLGGVFASRYAVNHQEQLRGVFYMGSYADEAGSLKGTGLKALQITASRDGVLNVESWNKGKPNMPEDTKYVEIEGGNHAQFGSYGQQKGDKPATITPEEQLGQVSQAIVEWVGGLAQVK